MSDAITDVLTWLGLLGKNAPPAIPAVNLFPSAAYPNPFATDAKLDGAVKAAAPGSAGVRFTIGDVTGAFATPASTGPFPVGNVDEGDCDYIASVAKVAVMYAAYELRAMVRRVIKAAKPTSPADLTTALAALNPQILNASARIQSATTIDNRHRLPKYSTMFKVTTNGSGTLEADFTPSYARALSEMIVISDDSAAATCIHGIGYSYLNGALAAVGFFTDPIGVWVAGDYLGGASYPAVRLATTPNDDPAAEDGTTLQLARMFALIKMRALVSSASSADDDTASGAMEALLQTAATTGLPNPMRPGKFIYDKPWASRAPTPPLIPSTKFFYNKLGYGSITLGSNGPPVYSETSLIKDPVGAGRAYVVSWQHMTQSATFANVATTIFSAIQAYEALLPTVTGIAPTSGPAAGGTSVAVTGTNLTGITAVRFGGAAAASFVVNSSTQVTAVSPAAAAGSVDVTAADGSATSTISPADRFTFV